MTSLLTTANTYGWAGKNLRAGLGATRHPAGTNAPTSGNLSLSTFSGQYPSIQAGAGVVTTLAGSGASGSTNGTGTGASFSGPFGVATDSTGNLYVADWGNCLIRKIVISTGVVTTLAGSGAAGSTNGTGTGASFASPSAVATDSTGNLYVADLSYCLIRKIVISTGVVTTLAGSGSSGSTNGTGTGASFFSPSHLTIDSTGNLYVADTGNHLIRKIVISTGVVTTLAGSGSPGSTNGTGTGASFYGPIGVATDSTGNLYIGDTDNNLIRKMT